MPDNSRVVQERGPKNPVSADVPHLYLNEQECGPEGSVQSVNTVFLTNKECPFKCVMCDLWKNTLDESTPPGAIPRQIEYALGRLPHASVIKLYNSGNFFDTKAIPKEDYPAIAGLLSDYDRVIVENHPKLCGKDCLEFLQLLNADFEIALGLETVHPVVLPKLNKQITCESYRAASRFLTGHGIDVRTFILLNPPFLTDPVENIEWSLKSVRFAFDHGSTACSIIPTRPGNGIMDRLLENGQYRPPTLESLETVFEQALSLNRGRIFADLWDLEQFAHCQQCFESRKERLHTMNLEQRILPDIPCSCRDQNGKTESIT